MSFVAGPAEEPGRAVDGPDRARQSPAMRSKLLTALVLLLSLLALVLAGGLVFVSPEWEVSRSRVVKAPAARVHATVADLHGWPDWTAWSREADPEATWSFEGALAGTGAMMRWNGPRFGRGRLTLTSADPGEGVEYETVMESNADTRVLGSIAYRPVESGTEVSWHERGRLGWNPFLRLMKAAFERTMGDMFEHGLAGLARRVETRERRGDDGRDRGSGARVLGSPGAESAGE